MPFLALTNFPLKALTKTKIPKYNRIIVENYNLMFMKKKILGQKALQAIKGEKDLQKQYGEMLEIAEDNEHQSVLRDLILNNEMNEVLLRSMYNL